MANLCDKHNLVQGTDGKCVLCRREHAGFVYVEPASRGTLDAVVTTILGLGLLAAAVLLVWTARLPPVDASPRYVVDGTAPSGNSGRHSLRSPSPVVPVPAVSASLIGVSPVVDRDASRRVRTAAPIASGKRNRVKTSLKAARAAVEEAKRSVEITMYSTSWCTICETSRYYLEGRELTFEERDIEANGRVRKEMNKLNPMGSVPTFVVAGEVLIGFNPWQLEDMLAVEARKRVSLACPKDRCVESQDGPKK